MSKLDSYYTRRDWIRDKIAHWLMRRRVPFFGSWELERHYARLATKIDSPRCIDRHTGQFCFHCAEKRH